MSGQNFFPVLGWPQIVYPQQVVVECAGRGVGAQLSDHGLSELCHPGDCLLGMKNHAGKRKQCGKFVLPRLLGRMSCGSGSGLGSTQYTKHRHDAEPKFCAAVVFLRLMFLSPVALLVPHSVTVPRYPKHAAHLPPPPSYFILHTHEWTLSLQRHTHSATGNKNISL